ncbi:MAG: rhodanese-like domain-containing protein [Planctomycetes bacterium]|nr:rhodanese-like domain-containing protein [Planctomycetota bacterium]
MGLPEITPHEARQRLESGEGYTYLDVRTAPEFAAGHPPGALNLPVAELNPATGRMELSPRFLGAVQERIARDAKLIVGCQSGGRSGAAVQILLDAGYPNVCNMLGGFGGMKDPSGQIVREGWSTLGFPVERGPA